MSRPITSPGRRAAAAAAFAAALVSLPACGSFEPQIPSPQKLASASERTHDQFVKAKLAGFESWNRRAESPDHIRAAIRHWERAFAIDPYDRDTLFGLAVAHYYLGNYYTPDEKEKIEVHRKGNGYGILGAKLNPEVRKAVEAGEKLEEAVVKHATPGDVPVLYWMTVTLARAAENEGIAVRATTAPKLRMVMEKIYELGPSYYYGGVHRFFGAYYIKAPGVENKLENSKREFELAIKKGPENLENFVLYAEYWAKAADNRAEYERLLKHVIDSPPEKDVAALRLDNAEARKRAKRFLETIDEDF